VLIGLGGAGSCTTNAQLKRSWTKLRQTPRAPNYIPSAHPRTLGEPSPCVVPREPSPSRSPRVPSRSLVLGEQANHFHEPINRSRHAATVEGRLDSRPFWNPHTCGRRFPGRPFREGRRPGPCVVVGIGVRHMGCMCGSGWQGSARLYRIIAGRIRGERLLLGPGQPEVRP
jgi:hypothetical protein